MLFTDIFFAVRFPLHIQVGVDGNIGGPLIRSKAKSVQVHKSVLACSHSAKGYAGARHRPESFVELRPEFKHGKSGHMHES